MPTISAPVIIALADIFEDLRMTTSFGSSSVGHGRRAVRRQLFPSAWSSAIKTPADLGQTSDSVTNKWSGGLHLLRLRSRLYLLVVTVS